MGNWCSCKKEIGDFEMFVEPCVVEGSLICDFCFKMNLLSSPEVEGEEGAWVVRGVTNSITPKSVVVEGTHNDGKWYREENLVKVPLKRLQRWYCSFIWCLAVGGEGKEATQLPLVKL